MRRHGVRDVLLSGTIRLHRALRRGGVDADPHVFEGMWHSLRVDFTLPEHREYCATVAQFFERRLAVNDIGRERSRRHRNGLWSTHPISRRTRTFLTVDAPRDCFGEHKKAKSG